MASTKRFSNIQEQKIANELGWEVVAGSGARPCHPGDVISDDWLGECKTHMDQKSIFFDYKVWQKISDEATMRHRMPVLITDDGSQDLDRTWMLCRKINMPLDDVAVLPGNLTIKKNISFDHQKEMRYISQELRQSVDSLYGAISLDWQGEDVLIMPFITFKENFDR